VGAAELEKQLDAPNERIERMEDEMQV